MRSCNPKTNAKSENTSKIVLQDLRLLLFAEDDRLLRVGSRVERRQFKRERQNSGREGGNISRRKWKHRRREVQDRRGVLVVLEVGEGAPGGSILDFAVDATARGDPAGRSRRDRRGAERVGQLAALYGRRISLRRPAGRMIASLKVPKTQLPSLLRQSPGLGSAEVVDDPRTVQVILHLQGVKGFGKGSGTYLAGCFGVAHDLFCYVGLGVRVDFEARGRAYHADGEIAARVGGVGGFVGEGGEAGAVGEAGAEGAVTEEGEDIGSG